MRTFEVTNCRAEIIKPGTNLTVWAAKNKPFAVCNASLYDFATKIPIGTIIENGVIVHNDGNGFGCGIMNGKDILDFGKPWDCAWSNYLTGYNSPVQDGVFIAPGFSDSYVFDCRLQRIGVGRKHGKTFIVTDDGVTLREFAIDAISQGFDTLVNLDGGGSRHLQYDGTSVYSSVRVPYNAIAFFKKTNDQPVTTSEEKSKCPYPEPVRNLVVYSKGDDVKWLQWYLTDNGFPCTVDGIFGWATWRAVWDFQKTWTKYPDGICGPNTRRELKRGG